MSFFPFLSFSLLFSLSVCWSVLLIGMFGENELQQGARIEEARQQSCCRQQQQVVQNFMVKKWQMEVVLSFAPDELMLL